ncbi:MAG: hypothetical protein SGARI_005160, partial [Bacillariaceae sp.]
MSFADFLRAHWQQPPRERQEQQRRRAEDGENDVEPLVVVENGVIDYLDSQAESAAAESKSSDDSDRIESVQDSTSHHYAEQANRIREAVLGREANRQNTEWGGDAAPVPVVDEDAGDLPVVPNQNEEGDAPGGEEGENDQDGDNLREFLPQEDLFPPPEQIVDAVDPAFQDDQAV